MNDDEKPGKKDFFVAIAFVAGVILVLILWVSMAHSQDNRGVSTLGMCSPYFPCNDSRESFKNSTSLRFGWLDNTFAPGCECAVRYLKDRRPKLARVHVLNGPCLRNQRCGSYELFAGETIQSAEEKILGHEQKFWQAYRTRLERVKLQLSKGRNLECFISPCLECDFKKSARKELALLAAEILPQCKLVDNPLKDSCLQNSICEGHSDNPPISGANIITDLDGTDYYDIGSQAQYGKRFPEAIMNLAHTPCMNGLPPDGSFSADPRKRKNFCGSREFKSMQGWTKPDALEELAVDERDTAKCKVILPAYDTAKREFLWKLGDGHGYAITLFPTKFKQKFRSVIVTKAGKRVDSAHFRHLFTEDKSNRMIYDFTKHSSDFQAGSVLHADSTCWVLDLPHFRID